MNTIEAADLSRIILDDSEPDRPNDLYTLTVHEARTLARAVDAAAKLADTYEAWARQDMADGDVADAVHARGVANHIRAALNGETA